MSRSRISLWVAVAAAIASLGGSCSGLVIRAPLATTLYQAGNVDVEIQIPWAADLATLVVNLDDGTTTTDVTGFLSLSGPAKLTGQIPVPATGVYALHAQVDRTNGTRVAQSRTFEALALTNPDHCEVLNSASCMLPYPSDVFLTEDLTRPAGFNPLRVDVDASALPVVTGPALDPTPYNELDGFSPTVQILMHFPGAGVDLALSNASRLLPPGSPVSPPYVDTRTHDGTSLLATSPSLLIDTQTGERVLHFLEVDARADGNPARQSLIMRPGRALTPGRRYIVAIRDLVEVGGAPIEAEAPFAALRDDRATTIGALESRRAHYEADIFPQLASAGVNREDLILAFDFTVQSEAALTGEVLSMRDDSYTWLGDGNAAFTVASVEENDCDLPDQVVWRVVRGTYEVPLFLTADPEVDINSIGLLNHTDSDGLPDQNGVTNPPYTISLPCSALEEDPPTPHPVVLGHGLFGVGDDMVTGFGDFFDGTYIGGATNWRGMSTDDLNWIVYSVIGFGSSQLNNFPALPDRLKQGQINTQVLARMMKHGLFNTHACFQVRDPLPADCTTAGPDPLAEGVFPGSPTEDIEMFYFGVSLGGIMGTWFAALTSDVERFNVDVPAINFSILLQRSTQFSNFDPLLNLIGLGDPMDKILGLGLIHELWVKGEPSGYVKSLASEVASDDKKLLITVAWLDKQVSNQATEIMARSLGVSNLIGSVQEDLQEIPDAAGPLSSALVIYDTGSFDIFDPAHDPYIPPLANLIPSPKCDPHGGPRISIPASIDQVTAFLQPGGQILNYCIGICDGVEPNDQPEGGPCDPLAP
jgi:hypothetical protein